MKRITHNDIYALANSIKPVYFDTKGMLISFKFITDSRFTPENQIKPLIEVMIKKFKEKVDIMGLKYTISNPRKLVWGEPEPCIQYRVNISILKPRYQREEKSR